MPLRECTCSALENKPNFSFDYSPYSSEHWKSLYVVRLFRHNVVEVMWYFFDKSSTRELYLSKIRFECNSIRLMHAVYMLLVQSQLYWDNLAWFIILKITNNVENALSYVFYVCLFCLLMICILKGYKCSRIYRHVTNIHCLLSYKYLLFNLQFV